MTQSSTIYQIIGYSFGFALSVSLITFLICSLFFGFNFEHWSEWQGRFMGMVCTITAIIGATIGFKIAKRVHEH